MARRPNPLPNDAMTREQVQELRRSLLLLSPYHVQEKYKNVLDRCRFVELATPKMMQELISLWKVLWKWRR
jgi:hypothetical protein